MPKIIGHISHFRGTHSKINGSNQTIHFDMKDILRSAVRVGKRNAHDMMRNRFHAKMEMRYKIAIILANTTTDQQDHLIKSGVYPLLDPSEKSNISYYLGLAIAHMLAEQLIGVKWLMHLDVYQGLHQILMAGGSKSRPDLFGLDGSKNWCVIEAKGRSNDIESGLVKKAKDQTKKVKSINRKTPIKIASVVYFDDDRVAINWRDPKELEENAMSLLINMDEFYKEYYAPIVAAIGGIFDEHIPLSYGRYYIAELEEDGIAIGLLRTVYMAYKNGNFGSIPQILESEKNAIDTLSSSGSDGTILIANKQLDSVLAIPLSTAQVTALETQDAVTVKRQK